MNVKHKNLRVSHLTEHNLMKIQTLEIIPGEKSLIIIKGPNEQGKTSAIRGLVSALGGKKLDPDVPIRLGESEALTDVILSDELAARYRVKVSYTPKNRYLKVYRIENDGEVEIKSGQTFLNDMIGSLTFNPVLFMTSSSEKQIKMLFDAIGKAEMLEQALKDRQEAYDRRTVINRQLKTIEADIKAKPNPAPNEVLERKLPQAVEMELEKIESDNEKIRQARRKLEEHSRETTKKRDRMEALAKEISKLKEEVHKRLQIEAEAENKLLGHKVVDTTEIAQRIQDISLHNAKCDQQDEHNALKAKRKRFKDAAKEKESEMSLIDTAIRDTLNSSDIGKHVPGLTVSQEGKILHNGVPISQASGMEQLKLSSLIGMSADPNVRVMCIDEGDRLDPNSINELKRIATEHNFQIWMTAIYAGGADDEHVVNMSNGLDSDAPPPPPADTDVSEMFDGTEKMVITAQEEVTVKEDWLTSKSEPESKQEPGPDDTDFTLDDL